MENSPQLPDRVRCNDQEASQSTRSEESPSMPNNDVVPADSKCPTLEIISSSQQDPQLGATSSILLAAQASRNTINRRAGCLCIICQQFHPARRHRTDCAVILWIDSNDCIRLLWSAKIGFRVVTDTHVFELNTYNPFLFLFSLRQQFNLQTMVVRPPNGTS